MPSKSGSRARGTVLTIAAAALLAAGCGSDEEAGTVSTTEASETTTTVAIPADADFNETDVAFAQGMIPHHSQAVEMAELATTNGASPEVAALAAEIQGAQQPEIDLMTQWLNDWDQPVPDTSMDMDGMHEMAGGMMMSGMVSSADMGRLRDAQGAEFDRLFLEFMVMHHEGAIQMAQQELDEGKNPEALQLAQTIIDTQQAEIDRMNELLAAN